MSRPLTSLALSALLLAALPAIAEAKSYKGKTSQGRVFTLRTGADGVVNRASLRWRAPCRRNVTYRGATVMTPPLDAADANSITDGGTYRVPVKGGFRARITATLTGQRDPATDRWTGTWVVKVLISRRGHVVNSCQLKRVRWTAR